MRFSEVAARAASDSEFFREIQEAANRAGIDGVGSQAWYELANYFAENDEELRLLTPPVENFASGQLNTDINVLNLLQTNTSITWTTTTTTTTSRLCTIPGICPRPDADAESAQGGDTKKANKKKRR
jgi:hypothetical protein